MTTFVIFQVEISDQEQYARYRAATPATIAAAGGRFIVRGGATTPLEGAAVPGRTVIVEFPDHQSAIDWYNGAEYTAARALREGAAEGRMYIVEGVD